MDQTSMDELLINRKHAEDQDEEPAQPVGISPLTPEDRARNRERNLARMIRDYEAAYGPLPTFGR